MSVGEGILFALACLAGWIFVHLAAVAVLVAVCGRKRRR